MWQVVGVLEPEQRVYEALTPRGQATVADIAAAVGVSRDRVSRILARLVDRGLVTRLPGRPARFAAVMPDLAAATLIAAHETQLQQLRVHAQQLAAAHRAHAGGHHPAELIEVIEGPLNVRNAFRRLQREARRQIRVFDKPPYTAEQPEGNADEYRLLGEGRVRYRTLYDRAGLGEPRRMSEIWNGIRHGEQARAASSLPMKMALCDDRLALIPVSTSGQGVNQNAYLVHPSSLLDALSELFEAAWDRAVPLNHPASLDADQAGQLTERDRELLGLLAAGSTDESIARTFGWSARTVHRHVHRLMALVGAETRFQAGLQAGRCGWL
jgi:DNA-binding CsgD family transcriptional regulator